MNNLADEKFEFDDEDFSDIELADLEDLSDADLDLDLDDEDLELSADELAALGEDFWTEGDLEAEEELVTEQDLNADQPPSHESAISLPELEEESILEEVEKVSIPRVATPLAERIDEYEEVDYVHHDMEDSEGEQDHRPVPRINIHAFCETDNISYLLEQAAKDRRLNKAHLTIQMGGVERAAEHFQNIATPNLIILETQRGGQALDDSLTALAEVCDPSTKVIVIGAVNDIRLYRDLMSKGISDYIVQPNNVIQIIRPITDLYVDPDAPPIGKTIAFVGSRGGVGSSTLCHNVAWYCAEVLQTDTVLMDLDLAFGTASLDFEMDQSQGLAEALVSPDRLDDVLLDRLLQKCTDRLSLFAAPNLLDRDYDLPAESFEAVIDIVRTSAPNVIFDLPHTWTAWTQYILQTADEIVLTATPDLASYRNTQRIVEAIKNLRGSDVPPTIVLNQTGIPKLDATEVKMEMFEEALNIAPKANIAWDPLVFATASANATTVFEANANSKASDNMAHIARLILGLEGEAVEVKKGFDLKSLFSKK